MNDRASPILGPRSESVGTRIRGGEARLIAAIQRVSRDPRFVARNGQRDRGSSDTDAGAPDRMQLLSTLTEKFSEDEIATLAFGLHVDVETLAGDNKTALARSLILHCEQTNRTDQLITICRDYRPDAFAITEPAPAAHVQNRRRRTRASVQ